MQKIEKNSPIFSLTYGQDVLKWLLLARHISVRSHNKRQEMQAVSFILCEGWFGFALYITQEEL